MENEKLNNQNKEVIDINTGYTEDEFNQVQETIAPDEPISLTEPPKDKKRHPFAYALGVGSLAFIAGFGGVYLGNQVSPSKTVIYQAPNTSTPLNASDKGLSIQEIAARNLNSVVEIQTEDVSGFLNQTYVQQGAGSGVIFSEDGYIITNNHVIDNASQITVKLHNGESYTATLVGKDSKTDLAVLKIEATGLISATLGDSDAVNVGDVVVAIGNPLGQLGGSVTDGIISALNRSITLSNETMNLLQTNAQVSPGNSGGGLFDGNGNLIGIVVAKSNAADTEGIGFVIPINDVKKVVEEIITHGYVTSRPALGIYLQEVGVNSQGIKPGVYITEVMSDSAASKAGLIANDRIIAINDMEVDSYSDLSTELAKYKVDDTISIQVVRDGKTMTFDCKLQQSTNQ